MHSAQLDLSDGFSIESGFDWSFGFTVHQGATISTPVMDLTGFTGRFEVRSEPGSTALVSLTSPVGITLGGTAGTVQIALAATETALIPPGQYRYDFALTSAIPSKNRYLTGYVEVLDRILDTGT